MIRLRTLRHAGDNRGAGSVREARTQYVAAAKVLERGTK